jgi:hypothetical protein
MSEKRIAQQWFATRKVEDDLYCIQEVHYWEWNHANLKQRLLFSGDVFYDGDLLDQLPGSDIPTYIKTYERLQHLPVEVVHPGHYQSFGPERFQKILQEYLEAKRKPGCPADFTLSM